MKDLLLASDLLNVFRNDTHYSDERKLVHALRKFNLHYNERTDNYEQLLRSLTLHILDHHGESEQFLTEAFISAEALIGLLKKTGLTIPSALRPTVTTKSANTKSTDPAIFEKDFALFCRNCGTVTDPLGTAYHTPIGRLIYRTYLETLRSQGVKTTAWYVLNHLKEYDTDKVVTAVEEDHVTWKTEDDKEKMTSLHTIGKFILKLDRETERILGR